MLPDLVTWFPWQELVYYLPLGAAAGVLAGMLGIGGGLIIVPVLIFLFTRQDMNAALVPHLAIGSSLATIIFTSLSSIRAHHRRGAIHWAMVAWLTPGVLLGAWAGAIVADWFSSVWLQRIFAGFVLVVGLRMIIGAGAKPRFSLPNRATQMGVGGLIGLLSALVGIGGGTLTVPFLTACRVDMRRAVATSSAVGLPIALAGTLGFLTMGWGQPSLPPGASGYIYWPAVLSIATTSVLFAPLGAHLAHSLPVRDLKKLFGLLLLFVGMRLLY